ncbi:MAG: hypothetical protein CM1200mP16_04940 [Nitrospina sp.]|nr:MAG: hypothetical protein CM1200mP16_04940 [Nitrospina sp.]
MEGPLSFIYLWIPSAIEDANCKDILLSEHFSLFGVGFKKPDFNKNTRHIGAMKDIEWPLFNTQVFYVTICLFDVL